MRSVFIIMVVFFLLIWGYFSCSSARHTTTVIPGSVDTTAWIDSDAADGLDLQALTATVKEVSSGEELEKKLNTPNGINNLDLDADGEVDYIRVTEYGDEDAYGFSLTVEPVEQEEQEIATIEITKEDDQALVQVTGNEHVYGTNHVYHSHFPVTSFLLWSYFLGPRWTPYYSPWHHGYYPTYYSSYRTIPHTRYVTRTRTVTQNASVSRVTDPSKIKNTGLTNPNAGKVANKGIKRSLANPTATQKQFRTSAVTQAKRSGGFGKTTRTSSRTVRGSSSSRSAGGFGK